MFTMFFMIIFATLLMTSSSARPFEERDVTVSPCFLNCTTVALSTVGCSGLSDLHCLCNSASFRNLLTSCVHQFCPTEDDDTATFQEQECANYSTLSATELISGAPITSNTLSPTQTTQISAATSSPAPTGATATNQPVVSSNDTFAHLGNDSNLGSQNSSDHTGIIIGAVVGVVALMVIIFFLYWWRRRSRTGSDHRLVRRSNRMSLAGGSGIGHSYQGADATARPWTYPAAASTSSSSRSPPRSFILSTTPLTKPQPSHQSRNHGYHELRSPADQSGSEHSGTSPSSPVSSPARLLTRNSGGGGQQQQQRASMAPPPAYQPSSTSAKFGSWKQ